MADQATLKRRDGIIANGNANTRTASESNGVDPGTSSMVSNVAGFGENLLNLAELQTRLTAVELRQNVQSVKTGGALMMGGAMLVTSTIPVLMVGVAELLVSEAGFKRGYALLLVAMLALVLAGSGMVIARRLLSRNPLGFPLASEEFSRNINWLRTILRHSGRRPANR